MNRHRKAKSEPHTVKCFLFAWIVTAWIFVLSLAPSPAQISASDSALFLDFERDEPRLRIEQGAKRVQGRYGAALEFTTALQSATVQLSHRLDGIKAMSVGGWFFPRRSGEQSFFCRGLLEVAPGGERLFPRNEHWVNFLLGTDHHGLFCGTINGNGSMPFPQVTLGEVSIDEWHQLALVKDANGFQSFYHNGTLIHTDRHALTAGRIWPFQDLGSNEPVRLAMPLGGLIGEVWVFPRELSSTEIKADFEAKRQKYQPALLHQPELLREMDSHPRPHLWKETITSESWPLIRDDVLNGVMKVLGPFPKEKPPLAPKLISETDCGSYLRRKVSLLVQPGDRMPAYLLVPKKLAKRAPAIICFYGTGRGAGKDSTVGLAGLAPGTPPHSNLSFAIDMVEAGFVALAPDYLRDGERIKQGRKAYETADFYEQFPEWSIHGKDIWDTQRAIDYLQTLDFVDGERIGMTGHSYGGHSAIFAAALEPRIKVAVANGPVSDFLHHGMHWAVPKGGSNSQSLPAMRPYLLDRTKQAPVTFYEFTALIAPRPLLVGQAVGERRPMEEENYAAVGEVYRALNAREKVRYHWYAGDHDYPPEARAAAVEWFRRWL